METSLDDLLDLAIMGRNRIMEAKAQGKIDWIGWLPSEEQIRESFAKLAKTAKLGMTDPIE